MAANKRTLARSKEADAINQRDEDGMTAVMHAIHANDVALLANLLDFGGDPSIPDTEGKTAIHHAAIVNNSEVLEFLLGRFPNLINKEDKLLRTPLHLVSSVAGSEESLLLFLAYHANKNATDMVGQTPLHRACRSLDVNMVCHLLRIEVETNILDREGHTALMIAVMQGAVDILRTFVFQMKIPQGDVDADGRNILHYAAMYGQVECVKLLVRGQGFEKGINIPVVNDTDKEGRTPLHLAAYHGLVDVVELLLDEYSDKYAEDNNGYTPMHFAVENGQVEIVNVFLKYLFDVNRQMPDGNAIIHIAARLGDIFVLKILTQQRIGLDVNLKNKDGETPLHLAAKHSEVHFAKFLIAAGGKANIKSNKGELPIDVICYEGYDALTGASFAEFERILRVTS